MRSWRLCFSAFILFGLLCFGIAPSKAYAADYVEYDPSGYLYFVVPQSEFDAEGYSGFPYSSCKQVQEYHYSHTDLIDTDSVVSADYTLQQAHTGMFGGYLEVPSVNTTASGTVKTVYQSDGNNNGLGWDTNWYMQAYKRSGETAWGLKPAMVNSTDHYNQWVLDLDLKTTNNMTASGYNVDMSHATSSVSVTGTQQKTETQEETGTLTHQEYTTLNYKWLPFTSSEPVYLFIGRVAPSGSWAAWKDETYYFDINRYIFRYDSVTGTEATFTQVRKCFLINGSTDKQIENVTTNNGMMVASRNYNFCGFRIPISRSVNKGLLVPMPTIYKVDYSVESNNTTETNKQTAELKDTTGSDTTVTNAQGVFDNTIKSKLGFVAQTADITTGLFDALTYEGEGTVPFPALQWQGQTIIAAQNVPILGYIPAIEDDVKTGVTLVLFLAWLHGIHSLYARMFLGETMVEVDEE